jgi:hypothetical protein
MASDCGPYETEDDARAVPAVRAIYDAMHASTRRGTGDELCHRLLDEACTEAEVELGAYDHRILLWLAQFEPQTCQVIAGIIRRAAQPPEGTVRTHWGVRYPGEPRVREYDDEEDAREHLDAGEVVVSREVTAGPWTEAPGDGESGA